MNKRLVTILAIAVVTLLSIVIVNNYIHKKLYDSLDNVFLEMTNAAIANESNLLGLPDLSLALQSNRRYKATYHLMSLPLETNLPFDENISVIVGIHDTFILEYRKALGQNTFLYLTQTYQKGKLIETIELSNSDMSLAYALQTYAIDKKLGLADSKEESLAATYWFSSSKGLPTVQLTQTEAVLNYLKSYGIDRDWIEQKYNDMLYTIVLKRWFEKVSQRYSFDNLGNVEVIKQTWQE